MRIRFSVRAVLMVLSGFKWVFSVFQAPKTLKTKMTRYWCKERAIVHYRSATRYRGRLTFVWHQSSTKSIHGQYTNEYNSVNKTWIYCLYSPRVRKRISWFRNVRYNSKWVLRLSSRVDKRIVFGAKIIPLGCSESCSCWVLTKSVYAPVWMSCFSENNSKTPWVERR